MSDYISKNKELPTCPFCGTHPDTLKGFACCPNDDCEIVGLGIPIAAWNRRFVCPDSNGKAVFAGNEVRLSCNDKPTEPRVGIATLPPCITLDGVDVPIRLIKEDAKKSGVTYEITLIEDKP